MTARRVPSSLTGRLKMMSARMSLSSSGGSLVSASCGACAVPVMRTRASTPVFGIVRVAVTSRSGLMSGVPANLSVPSRTRSNRRPWNSYVPRTVLTVPTGVIGPPGSFRMRRSPPTVMLRLPSAVPVGPPGRMSLPRRTRLSGMTRWTSRATGSNALGGAAGASAEAASGAAAAAAAGARLLDARERRPGRLFRTPAAFDFALG